MAVFSCSHPQEVAFTFETTTFCESRLSLSSKTVLQGKGSVLYKTRLQLLSWQLEIFVVLNATLVDLVRFTYGRRLF